MRYMGCCISNQTHWYERWRERGIGEKGNTSYQTLFGRFSNIEVFEEKTTTTLWNNLGDLYKAKYLVNKLFMWKNLFSLRITEGGSVAKNLNEFSTIAIQLISIEVKMDEEDHCMTLLCSLIVSWDNLVKFIGSIVKALVLDDVIISLLSYKVRKKTFRIHQWGLEYLWNIEGERKEERKWKI